MTIPVTCPYCGFQNKRSVSELELGTFQKEIRTCDGDEGGCDSDFVIDLIIKTSVKVFKLEEANS